MLTSQAVVIELQIENEKKNYRKLNSYDTVNINILGTPCYISQVQSFLEKIDGKV